MSISRIIIFVGLYLIASVANATCPRFAAPSQFADTPPSWGNDSGPIVAGFVDSKRPAGNLFDLIHGVDLDSYNAVDYSKIIDCGGKFAIVRINQHANDHDSLDELFSANMAGLAKQQTSAFPYYFFALPKELRKIAKFNGNLSDSDEAQFRKIYESAGVQAAQSFLNLLKTAKYTVPTNEISGLKGMFVAVDVEQTPLDAAQANQNAAKYYGTFYSVAVCSWIKAVTVGLPQLVPVLYTFPAVYGDYLRYAKPDVNPCLQGLPVWVARTYGNGWEAIRETDPSHCTGTPSLCATDKLVQQLCEIQGGNRCIIHQYTHRGTAIAIGKPSKGIPPHIDLDRFYTSKTVAAPAGTQYVRIEDAFK